MRGGRLDAVQTGNIVYKTDRIHGLHFTARTAKGENRTAFAPSYLVSGIEHRVAGEGQGTGSTCSIIIPAPLAGEGQGEGGDTIELPLFKIQNV